MQTDEAAIHLEEILIEWGIPIEEASLYTSHSLKATGPQSHRPPSRVTAAECACPQATIVTFFPPKPAPSAGAGAEKAGISTSDTSFFGDSCGGATGPAWDRCTRVGCRRDSQL